MCKKNFYARSFNIIRNRLFNIQIFSGLNLKKFFSFLFIIFLLNVNSYAGKKMLEKGNYYLAIIQQNTFTNMYKAKVLGLQEFLLQQLMDLMQHTGSVLKDLALIVDLEMRLNIIGSAKIVRVQNAKYLQDKELLNGLMELILAKAKLQE